MFSFVSEKYVNQRIVLISQILIFCNVASKTFATVKGVSFGYTKMKKKSYDKDDSFQQESKHT